MKKVAYAVVYDTLKREILEGEFQIGMLLPTEPELEKRFGVSRTTVRRAIDLLSQDGFVKAQQGRGTEVLNYRTRQNLNHVTSITQTLINKGFRVYAKSTYIDKIPAPQTISTDLEIPVGEPVVRIQRIQMADDVPIALMCNYLPEAIVPGIEKRLKDFDSLYQFLQDEYGIVIDSAYDRISASCADFALSQMLEIPVGRALLYIRRVSRSNLRPVCADRISINGERYELEVNTFGSF